MQQYVCMYMYTCLAVPPPLVALTFMPDIEPPTATLPQSSFVPLGPYKRVRVLLRCESPGAHSLVSVTNGDRAAIADPSRRWSQTLARIQVRLGGKYMCWPAAERRDTG